MNKASAAAGLAGIAIALSGCGPQAPSELQGKWNCDGVRYEINGSKVRLASNGFISYDHTSEIESVNTEGNVVIIRLKTGPDPLLRFMKDNFGNWRAGWSASLHCRRSN